MSDITVTLPKKEYDELVEFKDNLSKINHVYRKREDYGSMGGSTSYTTYITTSNCIDEIQKEHDEAITEYQEEIKKYQDHITKLKSPKWWRIWK